MKYAMRCQNITSLMGSSFCVVLCTLMNQTMNLMQNRYRTDNVSSQIIPASHFFGGCALFSITNNKCLIAILNSYIYKFVDY